MAVAGVVLAIVGSGADGIAAVGVTDGGVTDGGVTDGCVALVALPVPAPAVVVPGREGGLPGGGSFGVFGSGPGGALGTGLDPLVAVGVRGRHGHGHGCQAVHPENPHPQGENEQGT